MMIRQVMLLISFMVVMAFIHSYVPKAISVSHSKDVSQNEDLCGGTGGNGRIIRTENNAFSMLRKDGKEQIIHLADQATIHTTKGTVSLASLKKGDRVTLVGGPNDGSFTADTIFLCANTQANDTAKQDAISVRNENKNYNTISGIVNASILLIVGLLWFGMAVFLRVKKQKSFEYLLFFTAFSFYLYKVLDYTLLQFQSLLVLKHFVPGLMLHGVNAGKSVNLIPLVTLTSQDLKTSLLNILMMMPFGFGLPFITHYRFKHIVFVAMGVSITIELLQLVTGSMANTTFRIADTNDVIFNTLGAAIGYVLFVGFLRTYRAITHKRTLSHSLLRYIAERPQ